MKVQPPAIFTLRQVEGFTSFVKNLPTPQREVEPRVEARSSGLQCLLLMRRKPKQLISRESFPPKNGVEREMVPTGGLKVWSPVKVPWSALLTELRHLEEELDDAPSGDGVLYALTCVGDAVKLHFQVEVPFGMFDLAKKEIERAGDQSNAGHSA